MAIADEFMHLTPRFYSKPIKNERKTRENNGVPVFENVEMCEIRVANDKGTIHHHRTDEGIHLFREGGLGGLTRWLTPKDIFPDEYAAFQVGREQVTSGTPLSEAPFLSEGDRMSLKALNIFSVEALANIQDTAKLGMQGDNWVEGAKAYLARQTDFAADAKLRAELDTLKAQLAELKGQAPDDPPATVPVPAPGEEVVTEPGPFAGMSKSDLRAYLKNEHGHKIMGQPGLKTLLDMAKEAAEGLAA